MVHNGANGRLCQRELDRAADCVHKVGKSAGPAAAKRTCASLSRVAALCLLGEPCGAEIARVSELCSAMTTHASMKQSSGRQDIAGAAMPRSTACSRAQEDFVLCLERLQAETDRCS